MSVPLLFVVSIMGLINPRSGFLLLLIIAIAKGITP